MHKITLVCSSHRENGFCNAGELLKILRAIEPETIFEEVRPADFDSYNKRSLEGHAVAKYRGFKSFQRVPVDRYDMPPDLFVETQRVLDCVEQTSHEYLVLREESDNATHLCGFTYLNSAAFAKVRTRMSEIEEKTINETADQGLIRALERWRHVIRSREREMISVIYEYCRGNAFDTGVFLVGAAHKMGIAKVIEHYSSAEADLIEWKFYL
jgi:hypothetical protein